MAFIPSPASSGGGGGGIITQGYGGYGTPAKYVIIATSNGNIFSVRWLDQDFGTIVPQYNQNSISNPGSAVNEHSGNTYYHNSSQGFGYAQSLQVVSTHTRYSHSNTGASSNYPPMASSMQSMLGNPSIGIYSNGSFSNTINKGTVDAIFYQRSIINSDHTDKSIVYSMLGNRLRAKDHGISKGSMHDTEGHSAVNTDSINLQTELTGSLAVGFSINGSMNHNASYNHKLKKFMVWSFVSSGVYDCAIYSGIDFDANPSPKAAFAAAGVSKQTNFQIHLDSIPTNNNETYYNPWFVLCNDGGCRGAVWFTSNGWRHYKFTPSTNGSNVNTTNTGSLSGTTSYGREQGTELGTSMIQSVDGKTVCVMAPYYYYHTGCMAIFLDKTNSNASTVVLQDYGTSHASYFLPYRDDGFIHYMGGNMYASNYNASYMRGTVLRQSSIETGTPANIVLSEQNAMRWPQFVRQNTTNYPAIHQVTDYYSIPYNYGAR